MDTFRFGRKLSLPSTIAIKHQVRILMASDRAKKAEEEARAQLTDITQMKDGERTGEPYLHLGIGSRSSRANGRTLW